MADKYNDPADDWKICAVGGLAGATYGGGGIFGFFLRSEQLAITEKMTFCAVGVGMGGNACGFSTDLLKGLSFDPVIADAPFSLRQVHLSSGKMLSSAVGVSKLSYGKIGIDSVRNGTKFFTYFSEGSSVGSGAGAFVFVGVWYSFVLNNNSINPITAYYDSAKQTVEDLANTWERGFQNLIPH
jgi:hypothetical protein